MLNSRVRRVLTALSYVWPLAALELLCRLSPAVSLVFAPPTAILVQVVVLLRGRTLLSAMWETVWKVAAATVTATAIGYVVGFLVGMKPWARRTIARPLDAARGIPTVVLVPVFFLVLGPGDTLVIAMATYPALCLILVEVADAVGTCSENRGRMCRALGIRGLRYARDVVFWESLPAAVVAIASALPMVVALVVALEYFEVCNTGLGRFIDDARKLRTRNYLAVMYSGIACVGLLGLAAGYLPHKVARRLMRWASWK